MALAEFWNQYSTPIITTIISVISGLLVQKLVIKKTIQKLNRELKGFIGRLLTITVWLIIITIIMASFNINVTGLITGLGLVGVIAGFALQEPLRNIASGVFIMIYKPFKINDLVKIKDVRGEVIKLGLVATIVKTIGKVIVTIPNSNVWGSMIYNYSRSPTRTLNIKLEILYENELDKVLKIINKILDEEKQLIDDEPKEVLTTKLDSGSVILRVRAETRNEDYLIVRRDLIKNLKTTLMKKGVTLGNETTVSLRE